MANISLVGTWTFSHHAFQNFRQTDNLKTVNGCNYNDHLKFVITDEHPEHFTYFDVAVDKSGSDPTIFKHVRNGDVVDHNVVSDLSTHDWYLGNSPGPASHVELWVTDEPVNHNRC